MRETSPFSDEFAAALVCANTVGSPAATSSEQKRAITFRALLTMSLDVRCIQTYAFLQSSRRVLKLCAPRRTCVSSMTEVANAASDDHHLRTQKVRLPELTGSDVEKRY